jgi:hypothetical protein
VAQRVDSFHPHPRHEYRLKFAEPKREDGSTSWNTPLEANLGGASDGNGGVTSKVLLTKRASRARSSRQHSRPPWSMRDRHSHQRP